MSERNTIARKVLESHKTFDQLYKMDQYYNVNPEKDISLQAAFAVSCALADLYVELYGIDAYERLIARSEMLEIIGKPLV